jgi:hypothetical protein
MNFTHKIKDNQVLLFGSETTPRFIMRLDGAQAIESYEKVTTTGTSDVADPDKANTLITSGGAHTVTLADGTYTGQIKNIVISSVAAGTITVTPANFANGTSITMDGLFDSVKLVWDGTNWNVAEASSIAIV